tara:strand:- start:1221 stop:1508 length:288 start_codon:yes stop_codon:yes gene_type:complete
MLIKLKTLLVENQGHKRTAISKQMYINTNNIISISDYPAIESFLIMEKMAHAGDNFCLVRVSLGSKIEDVIAFGTSAMVYSQISEQSTGRKLLND